jgi:hypothetical protein
VRACKAVTILNSAGASVGRAGTPPYYRPFPPISPLPHATRSFPPWRMSVLCAYEMLAPAACRCSCFSFCGGAVTRTTGRRAPGTSVRRCARGPGSPGVGAFGVHGWCALAPLVRALLAAISMHHHPRGSAVQPAHALFEEAITEHRLRVAYVPAEFQAGRCAAPDRRVRPSSAAVMTEIDTWRCCWYRSPPGCSAGLANAQCRKKELRARSAMGGFSLRHLPN